MKKLLLLLFVATFGTLAVSAYRGRPDGIFAAFRSWARPHVRELTARLTGATAPTGAGQLDASRCSFSCDYSAGVAGAAAGRIDTAAPDRHGLRAVGEILAESGLQVNFKVLCGNVATASAFVHQGERVIVYSKAWTQQLGESLQTKWAIYAVLAHEIGHHLNGDTMSVAGDYESRSADRNHAQELAADYFAGFVLAKLGASLSEATAAVSRYGGRASHSHPDRQHRIDEHVRGWNKGRESDSPPALQPELSAELVRLQHAIGRHVEQYGPGHVAIGGREVVCFVQYKLRFAGRTMKVKGIRYDTESREVAILDWRLEPRDGRPHPVSMRATGVVDGQACHRITIANAGELSHAAPGGAGDRDARELVRLLQRYVELAAQ